ncbi:MAG: hypothetical protein ABEJ66_02430 [Candidatus Nanohaloarchaea archaeon]
MIVGFNIESLEGSRSENAQGDLQVQYNPQITEVEEATVSAFEDKVAKIDFTFTVDYQAGGQSAATIELSGNVLWKKSEPRSSWKATFSGRASSTKYWKNGRRTNSCRKRYRHR